MSALQLTVNGQQRIRKAGKEKRLPALPLIVWLADPHDGTPCGPTERIAGIVQLVPESEHDARHEAAESYLVERRTSAHQLLYSPKCSQCQRQHGSSSI